MDKMQNEAMERLRQMYSKSYQQKPVLDQKPQTQPVEKEKSQEKEVLQKDTSSEKHNLLDLFMKDKEKSLIMLLIVILISEKADSTLILALMYLIL